MTSTSTTTLRGRRSEATSPGSWPPSKNPVKQATTWLAEKASRVKLSGMSSGEDELGTFLALETLSLGVEGRKRLWIALKQVQGEELLPALRSL